MTLSIDPILSSFVIIAFAILVVGLVLRIAKQPHVVAYIIAGVILGPHGFRLITDEATVSSVGNIGVVLLLFFIGMEISLPKLLSNWRVAVIGEFLQAGVSIFFVWLVGVWLDWSLARIILLGYVISLSSTAVVIKILEQWNELQSRVGQNVLSVLIVQDIAVIPMMITLSLLGGKSVTPTELTLQVVGALMIVVVLGWVLFKGTFKLPFSSMIRKDHELQVFVALLFCFGIALLTGFFGLSTALGAFVAGILVAAARETKWSHDSLHSFRVVFVALFFVSIGMLIDLTFIKDHWIMLSLLVVGVLVTNTFINAGILRFLGSTWRRSLYAGAFLSQIGEFSFILGALGFQLGIIGTFGYQATIAVISLSLLLSPLWISMFRKLNT